MGFGERPQYDSRMTIARALLARFPLLHRLEMRRRVVVSRWSRRRVVARYVAGTAAPRLQIGTGQHVLDGWMNTDRWIYRRGRVMYMDARRPLPLPSASFAYVFTEHQIEHITAAAAARMLAECHRVLRPGGRIRIATPDRAWVESLAVPPLSPDGERYVAWMSAQLGLDAPDPAAVVEAMFSGIEAVPGAGHQCLYSFDTLRAALEGAGFRDVVRREMQRSDDPMLCGIEGHGAVVGDEGIARMETLLVEAVRP